MSKRFLVKKTLIMCDIGEELLRGLPRLETTLSVVGHTNSTCENGKTEYGSCLKFNEFPFDCNINILWQEDAKAEDILDTLIHELCHAYSHQLGYSRNTAITMEDVRAMDEAYCRFSGHIGFNIFLNHTKITELFKKYLTVEKKKESKSKKSK